MTRYEKTIREDLEKQGYTVLSSGWPDFLAYRMSSSGKPEIRLVEVKAHSDHLRDNQKELHSVFSAYGLPVQVVWEENGGMGQVLNPIDIIAQALSQLGSRKSEAKAASSRENGKLGGRPKKIVVDADAEDN